MHPDIAQVVSGLFYHSLLETPASVAREREITMSDQVELQIAIILVHRFED